MWQILSFYKRRNWSLILADMSVPIKLILAATTLQLKRSVSLFTEKKKSRGLLQAVIQRPRLLPYCVFTIFNATFPGSLQMLISGVC